MESIMFAGDRGLGFSISDGNSLIQEKINVVQEVLTLLEETMSSAKSTHRKNQASYQARIDELELQIQTLRHELQRDNEDFGGISDSLEDVIQKYLNLENKLLTIEERSHDDYVELPELPANTDIYVAQYLHSKYSEWQRLKVQCQVLNQSTQNSYRDSVSSKRYKVSVASSAYFETLVKANALNIFRGKKHATGNPTLPSRFVCLTWYKHESASRYYVQWNYKQIIEEVFKQQYDEYHGSTIEIEEVLDTDLVDLAALASEITIHVQAKSFATTNTCVPRRITLYQFDDTYIPPPTQDCPIAPTLIPDEQEENAGSSSRLPESAKQKDYNDNRDEQGDDNHALSPKRQQRKSKSRSSLNKAFSDTIDVLSLIGLGDNTNTRGSAGYHSFSDSENLSGISGEPLAMADRTVTETIIDAVGGDSLHPWALEYVRKHGFEDLTNVQKELVKCFKTSGDIIYRGITNTGKTTGLIVGLLNTINWERNSTQALIVTPNIRSSKLIQKEFELIGDGGEHQRKLCKRIDQILQERDSQGKSKYDQELAKTIDSTSVLLGTLKEMHTFVTKTLVHKDAIRLLILYKADELYGKEAFKQKEHTMCINQILYALDATIKVVVIHRIPTDCAGLHTLCESKLRQKQILEEIVDMSELTTLSHRIMSKQSRGKQSSSSECSFKHVSTRRIGRTRTGRGRKASATTSTSRDSDVESILSSCTAQSPASSTPLEEVEEDSDEDEGSECRTVIFEAGLELLGIHTSSTTSGASQEPGILGKVTHLYANIDDGNDSHKIEMLSMLNLEKDKAILFCDNVEKSEWISTKLRQKEMWPHVLHEDVPPKERQVILNNYNRNVCRVLVCTDFLISVSLDSADVVINFDLPKSNAAYCARAAFATRKINENPDSIGVVVNLTVCAADMDALDTFRNELGIEIKDCVEPDADDD